MFDRDLGLRWGAPILHSENPPSQGSWEEKVKVVSSFHSYGLTN